MVGRRESGHVNQAICLGSSLGCIPKDLRLIRYSVEISIQLPLETVYRAACPVSYPSRQDVEELLSSY